MHFQMITYEKCYVKIFNLYYPFLCIIIVFEYYQTACLILNRLIIRISLNMA